MAVTVQIAKKELERQAALVFEGKTINVMLCNLALESFTADSPLSDWQSIELSGNGYTRFTAVVPAGAYDSVSDTYKIPDINASFTAAGPAALVYTRVAIYFSGSNYLHSLITENPSIIVQPGQSQTYRISLRQDD